MSRSMVSILFVLFQFSSVSVRAQSTSPETATEFVFRGFKNYKSDIQTEGAATIEPNGILRLTDQKPNIMGTAFYNKPVRLLDHKNLTTKAVVRSFSTSFVFSIFPSNSSNGGFGFTFTFSPTPNRLGAESGQYLGLFNRENDGNPKNYVFAIEFDTVQGFKDGAYRVGHHIGLNFNSITSDVQEPVVYYNSVHRKEDFDLWSGEPIRAILDYDGPTEFLYLTIYPAESPPRMPLISRKVSQLSEIVQEEMYVGFTAATGEYLSSTHYVMGWSFFSDGDRLAAARLALSDLPQPQLKKGNNYLKFSVFCEYASVFSMFAANSLHTDKLYCLEGSSDPALEPKILIVIGKIFSHKILRFFNRK